VIKRVGELALAQRKEQQPQHVRGATQRTMFWRDGDECMPFDQGLAPPDEVW
jgi:hypothetical protein